MSFVKPPIFPVFSTALEQRDGKIHPKINHRLQQTNTEKLQSATQNTIVANQNLAHIPNGNVMMSIVKN
jgi:guanylate kinase